MRPTSFGMAMAVVAFGMAVAVNSYGAELNSDSVAAGKQLAGRLCAVCHVVAPDQAHPPVRFPPAPSFLEIASRPGMDAVSLEQFLGTTHWDLKSLPMSMPEFGLTAKQRADAAAYILSLRQQGE